MPKKLLQLKSHSLIKATVKQQPPVCQKSGRKSLATVAKHRRYAVSNRSLAHVKGKPIYNVLFIEWLALVFLGQHHELLSCHS